MLGNSQGLMKDLWKNLMFKLVVYRLTSQPGWFNVFLQCFNYTLGPCYWKQYIFLPSVTYLGSRMLDVILWGLHKKMESVSQLLCCETDSLVVVMVIFVD